ncbi:ANTAR domain-containing response regulator [Ralstonia pseudosolanacearum]|uniref:ANTAR domain-containing response regulator n=1 Tax=Ralstonia solanacearum TaxID=305 RepID=A0AA92K3G5_RALSL|nr:ANTAR domain-containing response regulator [Ralstonia pseudosolanacearum]QOK92914.1 ANTAR domain-containing response regulator [Ralstonia pseudosolanacearum]QOK97812.1 ANTAR domain-containing response regulator [Ralstonia pseudosolanacearum]UWD90606.1 ANTAR domain-containing response regulator [Ralstonia pseudosolanacearum]
MQTKPPAPSVPRAMAPTRVLLVRDPLDAELVNLELIRAGLAEAGFVDVGVADADLMLPERIAQTQPDMVIVASESAARDTIEHVCVATQHAPRPIVLFTDNDDASRIKAAFAAGITAYIVDGLKPTRVKAVLDVAYARFEHERALRAELDNAKTQLAERKVLERAKGLLMQQMQLSEDEAFKRLRKMAMDRNIKLVEAAQRVIDVMAG